jgi:hypothetical protein
MRVISRFAGPALDESASDQRVKIFKELARLRASEPRPLPRDSSRPELRRAEADARDGR